ncbi:MAG: hypothetical protein ACK5N0_12545 [Synechococcaceae cyanobacterium]
MTGAAARDLPVGRVLQLTAEAVSAAIEPLLERDGEQRRRILEGYGRLRQRLGEPGVTQRAAAAILDSLGPC